MNLQCISCPTILQTMWSTKHNQTVQTTPPRLPCIVTSGVHSPSIRAIVGSHAKMSTLFTAKSTWLHIYISACIFNTCILQHNYITSTRIDRFRKCSMPIQGVSKRCPFYTISLFCKDYSIKRIETKRNHNTVNVLHIKPKFSAENMFSHWDTTHFKWMVHFRLSPSF